MHRGWRLELERRRKGDSRDRRVGASASGEVGETTQGGVADGGRGFCNVGARGLSLGWYRDSRRGGIAKVLLRMRMEIVM